ncbi:MAG: CPBP family intramembrane glutamic endopeptidase [Verrucomicrobiota bacterium]
MLTAVSPPREFTRRIAPSVLPARVVAWSAVAIGSKLPEIVCHQFNLEPGFGLALGQVIFLVLLYAVARQAPPLRGIAGFVLAITALSFAWLVVVPWLEGWDTFDSFTAHLRWEMRFAVARLIRSAGAILMLVTLIGSGLSRDDLFLRLGNWRAPVNARSHPPGRRPLRWWQLAIAFLVVSSVVVPTFYFWTLHPEGKHIREFLGILPLALVLSVFNAANEEFQFRSVILARSKNVLPPSETFLLSGTLFGLDHYFGQPSGWGGMILAGIAGWIWAKSMFETRGFTCAFIMHFVEDVLILGFFFTSVAP